MITQGNVGIGTTSPGQKLDVNGNIKGNQLCIGNDCRSSWPGGGGAVGIDSDILSTCSICIRYADLNGRAGSSWRCGSIETAVNTDFVGDVDSNDDFDMKISCTDPDVQNSFELCRRYADVNGRVMAQWKCVDFGQELNTDFVGDVNNDDDFDVVIKPKTIKKYFTTCGICNRYADLNGRPNSPWRCVTIGQVLKTDFVGDVNNDDDFDWKLSCNINFEDPAGTN